MLFLQSVPRLLRWIFSVVLIFLLTMTVFRFIFFWSYNPAAKPFSGSAFLMGLRFDAKFAAMTGMCILLFCCLPFLNPFKNPAAKKFWNLLLPLVFILLLVFYGADYYHYDYLHQRLNASVLNYLQDAGISVNMMWQTYPLLRILLALVILSILARLFFGWLLSRYQYEDSYNKRRGIVWYIAGFLVLGIMIFGKLGQFPLRWSDAFTLSDDYKANLALNPFQSFFSTLSFRNSGYDINKVRAHYPEMAAQLGLPHPDSTRLNFERAYVPADSFVNKPNIVLVICESFSAYKSSMYGNPLNTTPYFNELCNNGIFFERCFTPAYGTARGVWATVTGIPDVEHPRTASRNPAAVDQQTIINDFSGYSNFYFLGGDPTWANIQGLLSNNINGLRLYQQDDFKAKKIDVWGISDKNLLLEANGILAKETSPFFAIIQTADNHRPYTIPSEDLTEFKKLSFPHDSLRRYGFENNDEMNAFRYTDFCYQKFMEAAKKEKYFDNTIFVFIGDHGIPFNGHLDYFPRVWSEKALTAYHVPLLFYAPKLLQPKRIPDIASQADLLPSIAALAKIPHRNTTLGRNLFDSSISPVFSSALQPAKLAFIFDAGASTIGLITDRHYYMKSLQTGKEDISNLNGNDKIPDDPSTVSAKSQLRRLTDAYYETAKYMLLNNKKRPVTD